MEKKNVPKIRFPGFTKPWEQRKLESVIEDYTEKSIVENQYPVLTSSQQMGIVLQDNYFSGDRVSQSGNIGYFIIPKGYFAYRSRSDNNVFVFNRNDCVDKGIISYFYPVFKPKGVDSDFLLRRLNYGLETQLRIVSEGTGQHVLSLKKFKSMTALFPKFKEQEKIGTFFRTLDNLISLHHRKLENLKKQKKGLLQKMFPEKGKKVPEIRFPEFTNDWEQRKLCEVAEIVGGGTPSTTNKEYWDGDIDWYAPAEINNQIYVEGSERKITKLGLKKSSARILPAYKTVLFTSRAGIGKMAILRKSGTTNQGFQSIVLNDDTDSYFVYSMGSNIKEKAEKVASGSTFAEISGKALGNLKFMFPNKAEQKKIGDFFEKLDKLISLHQRKLEHLEKQKKALLQQMFV